MDLDLLNKTVFLLGGGPSLRISLRGMEAVRGDDRKIFVINDSIYCGVHADLLFFRDTSWYLENRETVETWDGIVVTSSVSHFYSDHVETVKMKHCDDFFIGEEFIKYGRSAGHIALSLAISLGAKCCVLIGYDCRNVGDRSHFCRAEKHLDLLYRDDFLPAWKGWGAAARRSGVEVVNATLDSAIKEFPYRPLAEFL